MKLIGIRDACRETPIKCLPRNVSKSSGVVSIRCKIPIRAAFYEIVRTGRADNRDSVAFALSSSGLIESRETVPIQRGGRIFAR